MNRSVIDRLLISKNLLEPIKTLPITNPDRYTIAKHILSSHDAAELVISGVAEHLNVLPRSNKTYLMDYFDPIKKKIGKELRGKKFFSELNVVRNNIKHNGIFPDQQQWSRVGENTFNWLNAWCEEYLAKSLDEIDESDMITNPDVKQNYDVAYRFYNEGNYREALEYIGKALYDLLEYNRGIRNISVGEPKAEYALKLSAFGVHANEFLAMQEFLPSVYKPYETEDYRIQWEQEKYGHPGNWNQDAIEFCLKTFVSTAIRIQDADRIPVAFEFAYLYEHKVTALEDGVHIINESTEYNHAHSLGLALSKAPINKNKIVHTLNKGESIRGNIEKDLPLISQILTGEVSQSYRFTNYEDGIFGNIEKSKVKVECVPKNTKFVKRVHPNLPILEYK